MRNHTHTNYTNIFTWKPDPGDQILLKIQSAQNHFKSNRVHRPRRHEPNATRTGSNGHRMSEISRSVQFAKQAKIC
jgi:hypothetical protein